MPETTRQQKITFAEMRASGVRGVLVYCAGYKCSHSTAISADPWPDDVRLSDIEPRFTCQACGQRRADVRPNFGWEQDRHTGGLNEHHLESCGGSSQFACPSTSN
jgi:hypothetical protein